MWIVHHFQQKKFFPRACTHRHIRELLLLLHDGIQLLFKGVLSCSGSEQSMSEFNEVELFFWSQNKTTNGLFVALAVEFYFKSIWFFLRKEHPNSTWKRGSQSRAIFCSIKLWKHHIWRSQPCKWVCGQRPSSFAQCDVLGPLPAGAFFCLYRRDEGGTHGWWILAVSWVFWLKVFEKEHSHIALNMLQNRILPGYL